MLKRIQTLRNIGRFRNCKAANVEFGKFTIIYGRNTYGKSTLGDVFASIQENDGQLVTGRISIPEDGHSQQIRLSLLPPSSTKEVLFSFDNGAWNGTLPTDIGIRAFDDGFIHRHVFVARQFNRESKEKFSAFVLGEQGVQQAKAIAEKKQARQKASRERNQLETSVFKEKEVGELESFLRLSPTGTFEESEERLHRLRNEHATVRKQNEQIHAIHARNEGKILSWSMDFTDGLKSLNLILALGLEGTHKEAKAKVAQHINSAFHHAQETEQWIRQGIRQNKGELCQFCGQELTAEAHNLLDLYRQAFDDAFDKHDANVKRQLNDALIQVARLSVSDVPVTLAKNATALAGYPELQSHTTFTSAVSKVAEAAEKIELTLADIAIELPAALIRLRAASLKKQATPHMAFELVDEALIRLLESQVGHLVSEYNTALEICNAAIRTFKKSTEATVLQQRLEKIEAEGKAERRNNTRIRLATQCNDYAALIGQIESLDKDIVALESLLQTDQSDYLKSFYESLNGWFKRFCSHDFTLERGETKQGHTPIYFLKVKFKGKAIDESILSQVFSESDRRALALAVFWTQLQSLPESKLAEQIVVLDDPLTSFDDHRITAVHSELIAAIDKVRQIIVLSHYRHDIHMFLETFRDNMDLRLLSLVSDGTNGTVIENADPSEFLLTDHQKAFDRMSAFSSGLTNEHSFGDVRIFFEAEMNSRFAAQIAQHKLSALNFKSKIDSLFEHGIIDDKTKKESHQWRQVLNPSHHTWTQDDLENQRNTVRDFLDFVYSRLLCKL